MADKFKVSLKKIIDEFKLESIFVPKDAEEIFIDENDEMCIRDRQYGEGYGNRQREIFV